MKRYIRLKNGKIIDTTKLEKIVGRRTTITFEPVPQSILLESDNITDLIQVGDLVRTYLDYESLECITEIEDKEDLNNKKLLEHSRQIYTKQGNDYICVWTKERGVI